VSVPLTRAITSGFAVYDTLFVELAFRENLRLATFDDEIIKTVPVLALRPPALSG
jgi:predicted nucleic acid-binding protein